MGGFGDVHGPCNGKVGLSLLSAGQAGAGLLVSGAVLWCPVSEQGTGGWLGLQFFCSCDLERYIPHHFSHTGFSLPLCRSCLIIGHGLLIKRSSVPDSFPASSSLSPFSSVKGTGLHQVMEFLRALGLSPGCISHVHQSSTRLVPPPGRLPCLAGRPGLLCTDCPAVPPSLPGRLGSSGWVASPRVMTISLHTHACGAAPCARPHHKYVFSLFIPLSLSGILDPNHFPPGPGSDM